MMTPTPTCSAADTAMQTARLLAAAAADDQPAMCRAIMAGADVRAAIHAAMADEATCRKIIDYAHPALICGLDMSSAAKPLQIACACIEMTTIGHGVTFQLNIEFFTHHIAGRRTQAELFRWYGADLLAIITWQKSSPDTVKKLLPEVPPSLYPRLTRLASLMALEAAAFGDPGRYSLFAQVDKSAALIRAFLAQQAMLGMIGQALHPDTETGSMQ